MVCQERMCSISKDLVNLILTLARLNNQPRALISSIPGLASHAGGMTKMRNVMQVGLVLMITPFVRRCYITHIRFDS